MRKTRSWSTNKTSRSNCEKRSAIRFSLSLSGTSLKSKEPDYFRLKPPSAYQAAARSILERNSQTVSFLQGRNVFYTRARVCRSFRRQRGRDTEGVRGIVREHFAARHYRSFCRWLNPEQVTQKLFDVNSGRWYSEDLEQFHPSARRIVPSPPPLLSDVARAQTLLADGIVRFLPRERRVTIRRAKSSALEWKRGQILPSVSFY